MWGGAGQWSRCTLLDWLTFPAPSLTPEGTALTEEDQVKLTAHTTIVCSVAHSCYRMCATECNAEVGGSVLHSVAHIPVQNVYMHVTDMYTYWLRGSSVWLQAAALLLAF